MGSSQDKEQLLTEEIKSQSFVETFTRKITTEDRTAEDEVELKLHKGNLEVENTVIPLEITVSKIKLILYEPYLKQIILCFDDNSKWQLTSPNLNTFLTWKQALSISMRPSLARAHSRCQVCSSKFFIRSRSCNCKCCGKQLCKVCSRFIVQLKYLGYNSEEKICELCKPIVLRIKSEEVQSGRSSEESKSFYRVQSNNQSYLNRDRIRNESVRSIMKTGCPSALNTLA